MTLILSIAGAIVVIAAAWVPIRNVFRLTAKVTRFIDEVVGEPAQFGRPARPGAIERMDRTEKAVAEQAKLLQEIHHEVHPNSGLSMRDAVDRLEKQNKAAAEDRVEKQATTAAALDRLEIQATTAANLAADVKNELEGHEQKVQSQFDEHHKAITTLAEAVKVAALSTPPHKD